MAIKILRGNNDHKFFGIQIVAGCYTLQYACGKFGIYNDRTHLWWPHNSAMKGKKGKK